MDRIWKQIMEGKWWRWEEEEEVLRDSEGRIWRKMGEKQGRLERKKDNEGGKEDMEEEEGGGEDKEEGTGRKGKRIVRKDKRNKRKKYMEGSILECGMGSK